MCRSKALVVLDMHLIRADNQRRVKDPLKHLTWNVLTKLWFKLFLFLQK